ncbi:MAG: hypothetical protein NTV51_20100, partial [Verrucomicrobia bacterium]|nr:hypothetical protein [Verrucomicrobiota bacterium]
VLSARGAVFFNNLFIVVGSGVATSFDGGAWTARDTGLPAGVTLNSVAAGPSSALAVGSAGTIVQSPAAASAPSVAMQPVPVTENPGGNVAFTVTSRGSVPLSYQWQRNGASLPGATDALLFLPAIQAAQAGGYACVIANSAGTVTSASAELTVVTQPPAPDPLDAGFAVDASFSTAPLAAALQSDGKIIVGGSFQLTNQNRPQSSLARLNANGSLDPTFVPAAVNANGAVRAIVVQPDGKIVIGGSFSSVAGTARPGLARLNADGSLDPAFVPTLPGGGAPRQIALTPDGLLLIVDGSTALSRLKANGGADPAWRFPGVVVLAGGGTQVAPVTCTVERIALLSTGEILAFATTPIIPPPVIDPFLPPPAGSQFSVLVRLGTDGLNQGRVYSGSIPNGALDLRAQPDGTVYLLATQGELLRLARAPGNSDYTVRAPLFLSLPTCLDLAADGKLWLGGGFAGVQDRAMSPFVEVPRRQVARLTAELTPDNTFDAGLGLTDAN